QDKEDDALIGVKSTALKFGAATKPWLTGFYLAAVGLFALAGILATASVAYFLALAPAAAHFGWQVRALDIHDGQNCLSVFKSNKTAGLLLLLAPVCEAGAGFL
ncbi:MAG: UbiA family prenyltransferase, partial [Hyphococcus sp.]